MSSGIKRHYHDDDFPASGRSDKSQGGDRKKPRDWREAFLDDSPRREHGRERERDRERPRDSERNYDRERQYGGRRGSYDDRRGERYNERRQGNGEHRSGQRDRKDYREREPVKGDYSRRYGDRSDRHRDDRNDYRRDVKYKERERSESRRSPPTTQSGSIGSSRPLSPPPSRLTQRASSRPLSSPQGIPKGRLTAPSPGSKSSPRSPARIEGHQKSSMSRFFDAEPEEPEIDSAQSKATNRPVDPEPIVVEEEQDPAKLLEERKRKREEIMAKFKTTGGKASVPVSPKTAVNNVTGGSGMESVTSGGTRTGWQTGMQSGRTTGTGATPLLKQLSTSSSNPTPMATHEPSLASTPLGRDFDLSKQASTTEDVAVPTETKVEGVGADMMVSAADYDPSREGLVDHSKRQKDLETINSQAKEIAEGVGEPVLVEDDKPNENEYEEVEIEVEDDEDDEFDMFAAFGGEEKEKKMKKVVVRRLKNGGEGAKQDIIKKPASTIAPEVVDNVDDSDGYYRITPGEILDNGRYQVTITLGKGMFSAVVKAKVLKAFGQERRQDVVGKEVAIKVVRSQESMYVSGRKEAQILQKLNDADPDDKKHILRLERTFEHRGHLCIVTESLSMNLRDVIKRFGKDVGLNMRAVRAYAHQMFLALSLMRKCGIVHADVKPDNILVTENKTTLKVCDLGSAAEITEGEITPYLVSRFYRAPEIILGLPYDTAIDMWSIGCTLYELYTGKILFPGRSNNHMLLLMMELKGKINHRMIKKASFGTMHFDESLNFISIEKDKITGQDVAKTMVINSASKDLRSRLVPSSSVQLKMKDDELKQLLSLVDLLDKCLQLDPAKRLTPRDALLHPFVAGP
ncbi:serine/threonine-protein kinase PRP4 [Cryptococcus neoformans Bt63]|nr:serine/threonine-protein kinase PRP4 [Cryptococcus neoformans var. grubii Bt63]